MITVALVVAQEAFGREAYSKVLGTTFFPIGRKTFINRNILEVMVTVAKTAIQNKTTAPFFSSGIANMGLSPMMGALADRYGSSEAVFYTTGAFAALASAAALLLMILKRREKSMTMPPKSIK